MDETVYRFLKYTAIALVVAWVGWSLYDSFMRDTEPGDRAFHSAERLFEDRAYQRALEQYQRALQESPDHIHALRGYARTMMMLGENDEALRAFNDAIELEPDFGGTFANRGILYDRMGDYKLAIQDYEHSLELDQDIAKGPHWLTRFLRLQPEKPPGIAERAAYLRAELAKPEGERLLRVPELDEQQRSYKQ
ncbi:MAG: tetratricopeptide repeat protein [Gammaproteobacteria bacterium]|nr:tetratricopeptide repeat protein [Gammaproteobacteria bacterium]